MLDFAIFAVTFVIILVGAVLYLYPVIHLNKTPSIVSFKVVATPVFEQKMFDLRFHLLYTNFVWLLCHNF